MSKQKNSQIVYAVTFSVIAVVALVGLVMVKSEADDTTQSGSVANATPTVDSVTTALATGGADDTSLTLTENTTTTVYVHGTATDNNGCAEIDAANQWSLKTIWF